MNTDFLQSLDSGCDAVAGFRFAGIHCGIKRSRRDLALLVADGGATAAGMFTSNRVTAPPVHWCRSVLAAQESVRAVVVNSGNANACTGEEGRRDAEEMANLTAAAIDAPVEQVLVSSTGVIGQTLPMDRLRAGIPEAASQLDGGAAAAAAAAEAILTTDTCEKTCAFSVQLAGGTIHLAGMAKGSGMIAPDLRGLHATTLAYFVTDAAIGQTALQEQLESSIAGSFNAITVDGDTSTNDTALLLASGSAGVKLSGAEDRARFATALDRATLELALAVVRDGEGAQRLIEVRVEGAGSSSEARQVARTVAESPLVKTAFCAGEPNWGRFMMAVGRSGVAVDEHRIAIRVNDLEVVASGLGTAHDPAALRGEMTRDRVLLAIDIGQGDAFSSVYTCDLSEEYVRINGHYLT